MDGGGDIMADEAVYPVPRNFLDGARVDASGYSEMYGRSVSDPEGFWGEAGRRLDWMTPYTKVKDVSW
ncbi:MAG: acetyl-coenzyme A synthetase N-terminal domain-containing protein, partial [Pseudomonadota bacterium]